MKKIIVSGDRKGETINVRPMNIAELKSLSYGDHVLCHGYNGIVHVKINGKPKIWKTRPDDVTVPVKYGLYEYRRVEYKDGVMVDSNVWIAKEE